MNKFLVISVCVLQVYTYDIPVVQTPGSCDKSYVGLNCPKGKVIDIVSTFYGRGQSSVCGPPATNTSCSSLTSTVSMKFNYNGLSNAVVYIYPPNVGMDPCYGTLKQLNITYRCINNPGNLLETSPICDGQHMYISCGPRAVISISSLLYGKWDKNICPGPYALNDIPAGADFPDMCTSISALDHFKANCDGKYVCELNTNMNEDPCVGTRKYLIAKYYCIEPRASCSA
ncbi:rhamnose-binding lectin isoform X1 [Aethina tumida]|uniref:rhamnose-binding lectin isoform X1 n=1 Tax=Aethina tumida TaxID=116153 RepID=UPI00096B5152|nr:rhamnose-binding lectin isoform X1 [Aethina tumida]